MASYLNTILADNPYAYYRHEEPSGTTATDVMGSYDGTYNGGVTLGQPSLVPCEPLTNSVSLDGVDDYVDLGTLGSLGTQLNLGISISAWVRITSTGAAQSLCGGSNLTPTFTTQTQLSVFMDHSFVPQQNNLGRVAVHFIGLAGPGNDIAVHMLTNSNITDGNLHHFGLSIDPVTANVIMTLDGVQLPLTYINQNPIATFVDFNDFSIGAYKYWNGHANFYNGGVDEFVIFNRPLSASELINHYNVGMAVAAASAGYIGVSHLSGLWMPYQYTTSSPYCVVAKDVFQAGAVASKAGC